MLHLYFGHRLGLLFEGKTSQKVFDLLVILYAERISQRFERLSGVCVVVWRQFPMFAVVLNQEPGLFLFCFLSRRDNLPSHLEFAHTRVAEANRYVQGRPGTVRQVSAQPILDGSLSRTADINHI
jgi:hypothetical protein